MTYEFDSGYAIRIGHGVDYREAIKDAWATRPPKDIGFLVRFRRRYNSRQVSRWQYWNAREALEAAGYKIK